MADPAQLWLQQLLSQETGFLPEHTRWATLGYRLDELARAKGFGAPEELIQSAYHQPDASLRRELIETGTNRLFVRRNARGTSFTKVVDTGRSIARDKRTKAKRAVPSEQGDRGDHRQSADAPHV